MSMTSATPATSSPADPWTFQVTTVTVVAPLLHADEDCRSRRPARRPFVDVAATFASWSTASCIRSPSQPARRSCPSSEVRAPCCGRPTAANWSMRWRACGTATSHVPDIADAVAAQIQTLEAYSCFEPFSDPLADELASRLTQMSPIPSLRVFLCGSGSEAGTHRSSSPVSPRAGPATRTARSSSAVNAATTGRTSEGPALRASSSTVRDGDRWCRCRPGPPMTSRRCRC